MSMPLDVHGCSYATLFAVSGSSRDTAIEYRLEGSGAGAESAWVPRVVSTSDDDPASVVADRQEALRSRSNRYPGILCALLFGLNLYTSITCYMLASDSRSDPILSAFYPQASSGQGGRFQ